MKLAKFSRIIALTTVFVMFSLLLLSCGGNAAEDKNSTSDVAYQTPDEETVTEENLFTKPAYNLPVEDMGGYELRIISRSYESNSHWYNHDISAETETGDPINDAVYTRNKILEEKYNIIIKNIPMSDVSASVSKTVKAGDDTYDIVVGGLNSCQETLTTQGMLLDLKTMPYVDLSKPWWDQLAVEELSINDRLFATSCDLTVRDKDAALIFTFSKKLVSDHGLENLYELVLNGKWTFDKMFEMMRAVSKDLNGDGKINDEDQVGLLTQLKHSRALFNAAGEYMAKVVNGEPEITLFSERGVEICERIKEIQGDTNLSLNADEYGSKYSDVWDGLQIPMFSEDRALFYHAGMNRVTLLRGMETDFGIIPPPKYNEQQSRYYVEVDPWCTSAVSVPITVQDPDRIGLLLEALTYESRYTLLPAYYEINLKTKFARDEESREMIDIILNNRMYDIGYMYSWGNMGTLFDDLARGKNSLTTYYEKNETRIEKAMQTTVDKINAFE